VSRLQVHLLVFWVGAIEQFDIMFSFLPRKQNRLNASLVVLIVLPVKDLIQCLLFLHVRQGVLVRGDDCLLLDEADVERGHEGVDIVVSVG